MEFKELSEIDSFAVLDFLRSHYYKEDPLVIGFEPMEQDQFEEEFDLSCLPYSMSFGIIFEGKLIAVILNAPKDEHEADHILEDIAKIGESKWSVQLSLLYKVEKSADSLKKFGVEKSAHIHTLAVHKDFRGKGLAALLIEKSIESFKSKQFSLVTIDCTSFYSSKVCEKLGMQLVNTLYYSSFKDKSGNQIIKPPKVHDAIRTYVKEI